MDEPGETRPQANGIPVNVVVGARGEMSFPRASVLIHRAKDADDWASAAARHLSDRASEAVGERGAFHLVMAGGSTPRRALTRWIEQEKATSPLWPYIHIYFSDERGVPADSSDSNYRMVREVLLDRVSIRHEFVHRIEGELELESAASRYNETLQQALAGERFDLVVLGLGPDGHTASLIPGVPLDFVAEPWVGVGPAPMSPAQVRRVTLTAAALRHTNETVFWAMGEAKAEVVQAALQGGSLATIVPEVTSPTSSIVWMLDEDSSSRLES